MDWKIPRERERRGMKLPPRHSSGWIEVICGSMFSGKSEELIRRVRRAQLAKQKVQVFKPELDSRYSEQNIASHDGRQIEAISVRTSSDIASKINSEVEVVAIDEMQFLDEGIIELCQKLADEGKRVIVAGLDLDFRGEPFGPVPHLLAIAEYVDKLQAICVICGDPATRTQRLIDGKPAHYNNPVILVGAQDVYEARCRRCHEVPGKKGSLEDGKRKSGR